MDSAAFLDRTLESFSGAYDITRGAQVLSRRVDALAQMRALNSKYILSKKHVLWEANAFEHALFVQADSLTAQQAQDWFAFLTREAEPELVHPGAPCPPEGHMYTYLTVIFVCGDVQEDARRAIRKLKFTKNYRFSLRGWASGRALAVDLSCGRVYANAAGREMVKHFESLLKA